MRAIFPVVDISLADTPVRCRRGVVFIDGDAADGGWQLVVYDSRPGAFGTATGLELPFSARTDDGSLLTGWVCIGLGDPEIGVLHLRGIGTLGVRRPWHTLPLAERNAVRAGDLRDTTASPERLRRLDAAAAKASPAHSHRLRLPAGVGRLSAGQRLLAVMVLTFTCWGLLSLVRDVGRATRAATPVRTAAALATSTQPLLGSNVAIIERLGFGKRYVHLRDTLAISVLRTDGVTQLFALLPAGRQALADLEGECELVTCDLLGRRTQRRALVRATAISEKHLFLTGWVAPR